MILIEDKDIACKGSFKTYVSHKIEIFYPLFTPWKVTNFEPKKSRLLILIQILMSADRCIFLLKTHYLDGQLYKAYKAWIDSVIATF